jgi:hypothetical protein
VYLQKVQHATDIPYDTQWHNCDAMHKWQTPVRLTIKCAPQQPSRIEDAFLLKTLDTPDCSVVLLSGVAAKGYA